MGVELKVKDRAVLRKLKVIVYISRFQEFFLTKPQLRAIPSKPKLDSKLVGPKKMLNLNPTP